MTALGIEAARTPRSSKESQDNQTISSARRSFAVGGPARAGCVYPTVLAPTSNASARSRAGKTATHGAGHTSGTVESADAGMLPMRLAWQQSGARNSETPLSSSSPWSSPPQHGASKTAVIIGQKK